MSIMTEPPVGECVDWDCWKPAPYQFEDPAEPGFWHDQCVEHAAQARAQGCHVRSYPKGG